MTEDKPIERGSRGEYLGQYYPETGEVSFAGRPTTRTRLHEIGHKLLGHRAGEIPVSEYVDQELQAEAFSYRHMDRPVTYKIARPVTYELVTDFGFLPLEAAVVAIRGLRRAGVNPSKSEQDELYVIALEGRRRR